MSRATKKCDPAGLLVKLTVSLTLETALIHQCISVKQTIKRTFSAGNGETRGAPLLKVYSWRKSPKTKKKTRNTKKNSF
jgi:hypothetical protein